MYNYDEIISRILEKITNDTDKREGSIIYDAIAPVGVEIIQIYDELDRVANSVYADTAINEYLERRCIELGIERKPATKAIRKGMFNCEIPIGSRFGADGDSYVVIEKIKEYEYKLECEQEGERGNMYFGNIIPINYIAGLETAKLGNVINAGMDEEQDNGLRQRYFLKAQTPPTSGNAHQYKLWALEVLGVGDAKVLPLWDGPGTVKILITNKNKEPADKALRDKTFSYIENVRPIGAEITVSSPIAKIIDISVAVILGTNVFLDSVKLEFIEKIQKYLKSITFEKNFVSCAIIGSLLLEVEGVLDYTNLLINNGTINVELLSEEVAVMGTLEMGGV